MSVSTLVLLGLAVVWAIVLLPEGIKKLSGVRGGDSIRSFNHQLSSLQGPGGRNSAGAPNSNVIEMRSRTDRGAQPVRSVSPAVKKRRQEILTALGAAMVLSLLCTVAFGGPFVMLFVIAAALFVAYVVALYQVTNAPAPSARTHDGYAVGRAVASSTGSELGAIGRVTPVNARRVAN